MIEYILNFVESINKIQENSFWAFPLTPSSATKNKIFWKFLIFHCCVCFSLPCEYLWFVKNSNPDFREQNLTINYFKVSNEKIQEWNLSFEKALLVLRLTSAGPWLSFDFREILYNIYLIQTQLQLLNNKNVYFFYKKIHLNFDHNYSFIFLMKIIQFYVILAILNSCGLRGRFDRLFTPKS